MCSPLRSNRTQCVQIKMKRARSLSGAAKQSPAKRRAAAIDLLAQGLGVPVTALKPSTSYGRYAGRGSELKFFDTAISFNVDSTGEVPATGQLALIPQGVTESTRVGRKCVITSIQGKLDLLFSPGAIGLANSTGVILVVLDKQANGAAAAATDLFVSSANIQNGFHNLSNSQRFVILKKIDYEMNPGAGVSTAFNNVRKHVEFYKKCKIPMEYSSTTGAITEIRSNNIFLVAGCDANSDDLTSVVGNVRLRFSDGS